jgi:hypothetical protein
VSLQFLQNFHVLTSSDKLLHHNEIQDVRLHDLDPTLLILIVRDTMHTTNRQCPSSSQLGHPFALKVGLRLRHEWRPGAMHTTTIVKLSHHQDQTSTAPLPSKDLQRSIENLLRSLAFTKALFPMILACFVCTLVLPIVSIPTLQMSSEILPMTRLLTVPAQIAHTETVLLVLLLHMEVQ